MALCRIAARVRETYATLDARSIALGRIAMAVVLLLDLRGRAAHLTDLYSNDGLLPNHTVLWRPWSGHVFSPFAMASRPWEAAVGFVACAALYSMLLVGYRTKLAQIGSWLAVLALHGRIQFVQNGGDVVLGLLALWTAFLPTGQRFSVDSLLRRLRERRERTAEELADRAAFAPDDRPVTSLAATALLLQLAVIYLLNAIHKDGVTWREGSVVHYVLHQDRIVTWLGLALRAHVTPFASRLLTHTALAIELALPVLLLAPVARRHTRALAVVLVFALHGGFLLVMNLGMFVPVMMAFVLHFVPSAWWRALSARRVRRARVRIVAFDTGCGLCFAAVRVLSRLDSIGRLRFVARDAPEAAALPREVREAAIVVLTLDGRVIATAAAAWREIGRCLPALAPLGWILALPGARAMADAMYETIVRRRPSRSQRLGLAAGDRAAPPAEMPPQVRPPLGVAVALREHAVLTLMILAVAQVLTDNRAVNSRIGWRAPEAARVVADYLQLYQGWSMFAPEAPLHDFNLVVDAVTIDGRHVDPFNAVASPNAQTPGFSSPRALGQDWLMCDYVCGIAHRPEYHQALIEWIQRHPERTGRPQDAIASFEAYLITDDSPPPGAADPRNVRSERLLSWP